MVSSPIYLGKRWDFQDQTPHVPFWSTQTRVEASSAKNLWDIRQKLRGRRNFERCFDDWRTSQIAPEPHAAHRNSGMRTMQISDVWITVARMPCRCRGYNGEVIRSSRISQWFHDDFSWSCMILYLTLIPWFPTKSTKIIRSFSTLSYSVVKLGHPWVQFDITKHNRHKRNSIKNINHIIH